MTVILTTTTVVERRRGHAHHLDPATVAPLHRLSFSALQRRAESYPSGSSTTPDLVHCFLAGDTVAGISEFLSRSTLLVSSRKLVVGAVVVSVVDGEDEHAPEVKRSCRKSNSRCLILVKTKRLLGRGCMCNWATGFGPMLATGPNCFVGCYIALGPELF
ncbi:hypothetical protein Droror1_Dr00002346 [Drosera rotundifolia]